MLRGIVYDLDGTLVNSLPVTFAAFNHGIVQHGGRPHSDEELLAYFGEGEEQIFTRILGREKAASAYQVSRQYFDEHLARMPLHEGIAEMLAGFREAGVPQAIFTGRSSETTRMILEHHELLDTFVSVVCADHVARPKPAAEGLYLALSRMRMAPHEILFVGDTAMDLQAARSAGALGVAAAWDKAVARERLEAEKPRHWAEKPADIRQLWSRLASS